jgi:flagellar export protein FliJ
VKFRFRLDALLRVRHFELRRRIAQLTERRREHERLAALERAESVAAAEFERHGVATIRAGISAARVHEFADAADGWRRSAAATAVRAAGAEQGVARARDALLATRTRVEALQRLRERRLARWRKAEERRAQRELDEQGLRRFERRGDR